METKDRKLIAINGQEMAPRAGAEKQWLLLIPAGPVVGRDGRSWNNASPGAVVEHFRQLGRDLPVDIEHSTEHKAPKGDPAPAIGWVEDVEEREGAIWGRVHWNASGRELVDNRAYRYVSPVILYEPESTIIVGMTSVAVTNQPNFRLPALNSETGGGGLSKEDSMWKALLAALSLPETATEDEAVSRVKSLQNSLASATNRADNPSLEKFVPRADYEQAVTRATNAEQKLTELQKQQTEEAIETAINKALEAGKITPATVEYHKAQCRQEGGLERFAAYCEAAPEIGGKSGLENKEPGPGGKALNAQEKEICAALAISEEEYLKSNV